MRWSLLSLGLVSALGAQTPLHITSVERRGLPPYEASDRVYCLDGGRDQGLHVGDRLVVKRTGDAHPLGHLRVVEVRDKQADTHFEAAGSTFPMKGDLVVVQVLAWLPKVAAVNLDPLPRPVAPTVTAEAPPREGVIYFLPQQAELSAAGVKKLEGWVKAWGRKGRWAVQVPAIKTLSPVLVKQRAEALQAALRALGIDQVSVESEPRTAEGKFDPTWIRHWD